MFDPRRKCSSVTQLWKSRSLTLGVRVPVFHLGEDTTSHAACPLLPPTDVGSPLVPTQEFQPTWAPDPAPGVLDHPGTWPWHKNSRLNTPVIDVYGQCRAWPWHRNSRPPGQGDCKFQQIKKIKFKFFHKISARSSKLSARFTNYLQIYLRIFFM